MSQNQGTAIPSTVVRIDCTIPGCTLMWHGDGLCSTYLAELPFDDDAELTFELVQQDDAPVHVLAFGYDFSGGGIKCDLRTSQDVRDLADRLRAAADALNGIAGLLPTSTTASTTEGELR